MATRLVACAMLFLVSAADSATKIDPAVEERLAFESEVRVIVVTRPDLEAPNGGLSAASASAYISVALDVKQDKISPIGRLPAVAAELNEAQIATLLADPNVDAIYADAPVPPTLNESGPSVRATHMHQKGVKGTGLAIAVLDTGVDPAHPSLSGARIQEACFSAGGRPEPGIVSLCPNGLDVRIGKGAASACPSSVYGCDHGTHVSAIALGRSMSSEGVEFDGIAPAADLVAIQVFTRFESPARCGRLPAPCALSYPSDQLRALDWIQSEYVRLRIAAVNMSLGGGAYLDACDENPLRPTIETLRRAGIPTVIASGNDSLYNAVNSPACISSAVTVTATDRTGEVDYTFSNVSRLVDFAAPGAKVLSAVPGGQYARMSGTSMAAPHVSGAFVLLRNQYPMASALELEKRLRASSARIVDIRTDTPLFRLDLGTDSSLAEFPLEDDLLNVPRPLVASSIAEVTGVTTRRFILQDESGKTSEGEISRALADRCPIGSCEMRSIAPNTWVLMVRVSGIEKIEKEEVERAVTTLRVNVFDDEELSKPMATGKEG